MNASQAIWQNQFSPCAVCRLLEGASARRGRLGRSFPWAVIKESAVVLYGVFRGVYEEGALAGCVHSIGGTHMGLHYGVCLLWKLGYLSCNVVVPTLDHGRRCIVPCPQPSSRGSRVPRLKEVSARTGGSVHFWKVLARTSVTGRVMRT